MESKIAIIDFDSVAFYIGHPNKVLDENGNPKRTEDNSKFIYQDKTYKELQDSAKYMVNKILNSGGFTGYIGYIKGTNTAINRLLVNPEYKANRSKESPTWWASVKQILIDEYKVIQINGMEVDDAVNITRLIVPNSHICAIDKDLLSLEGLHYNWKDNKWVGISKEQATYAFWKDMLVGQPGDNIKGLDGVGDKNVIFTTQQFKPTPAYVLDLYCKKLGEEKGIIKFYQNYRLLKIEDKRDNFVIPEIINKVEGDVKEERIEESRV